MSQYPPYPQQPVDYQGYSPMTGDPLQPARYASILMIVLGIAVLLLGGCIGLVGLSLPTIIDKMPPEQVRVLQEIETTTHISPGAIFAGMGIFLGVVGTAYIFIGIFVRRGGLGWVISGIVITVITVLYLLLNAVGSLFAGAGGLGGACFSFLFLGLFGWLLILLIQATKSASRMRMMQSQYQAQYMQYQQMMQQYGQAGYGYNYSPPPPAPPVPNPPPPSGPSQDDPNNRQ